MFATISLVHHKGGNRLASSSRLYALSVPIGGETLVRREVRAAAVTQEQH